MGEREQEHRVGVWGKLSHWCGKLVGKLIGRRAAHWGKESLTACSEGRFEDGMDAAMECNKDALMPGVRAAGNIVDGAAKIVPGGRHVEEYLKRLASAEGDLPERFR